MSDLIARETQKLEQDADIVMFHIDLSTVGQGSLYFTPGEIGAPPAVFGGITYVSYPVKAEGFKWDGQGTPPTPTLTVTGLDPSFVSLVRGAGDLVGIPVTRLRTFAKFLDDGSNPDPSAQFYAEQYRIERKTRQTPTSIAFALSVEIAQRGLMIPARQIIQRTCTHTYRTWNGSSFVYSRVTCPYAGGNYYNRAGESVINAEDDICGKQLSDCKLRFGEHAELPFYGFPGVARTG